MAVENLAFDLEFESKMRQMLIQKIRDRAAELGRVPRQLDFDPKEQWRFYAVFSSWNDALKAAGFPILKRTRRLKYRYLLGQGYEPSREECIDSLRRLSQRLGNCRPTPYDIENEPGIKAGCPKVKVIRRIFGNLDKALSEAGLSHLPTRREKEETEKLNQKMEMLATADEMLKGKMFIFSSEATNNIIKMRAKELSIPVIPAPKTKRLTNLLNWMRGVEQRGALPSHNEIRTVVGELAFRFLSDYCKGYTLRQIGKKYGISGEYVRKIIHKSASRAVEKFALDIKRRVGL